MLPGRVGRWVAGLIQHSTDLQHAHSGLLQYGVVQQLWAGSCSTVPVLWPTHQALLKCIAMQ
jgi:hypothetical protein